MRKLVIALALAFAVVVGAVAISAVTGIPAMADPGTTCSGC